MLIRWRSSTAPLGAVSGWPVTFAAMFCLTVGPSALLVTGFGVFVQPLSREFHWNPGQVSFAVSLIALTVMFVAPLQGLLLDRYGARRVVLCSIPCMSIGLAAMHWLPAHLGAFYLAWVILPILALGLWPTSYLQAVSGWFDARLGLAIGIANAGIGVGAITVPPIAASLIESYGWRNAFFGLGALALLAFPVAALFFRENPALPGRRAPVGTNASPEWTWQRLRGDVDFRLLAVGYFAIGITGTGMVANLVPLLLRGGMSLRGAVTVMSLYGAAALAGRILTGFLLDRFFAGHVINGFVLGSAVATAGFALGVSGGGAAVAAVLVGFIMGAEFDVLAYAVRRYFGMTSFGRIYGAIFGIFQMGASLGAALIAFSIQRTGGYHLAMWFFFGALLVGFCLFCGLRHYPSTAQDSAPGVRGENQ